MISRGWRRTEADHGITYPLAIGIVEGLELYDVGMAYNPHDL